MLEDEALDSAVELMTFVEKTLKNFDAKIFAYLKNV